MLNYGFYNMNCMDGMREFPDKFFDIAVVDPPYFAGPNKRRYYGRSESTTLIKRREYDIIDTCGNVADRKRRIAMNVLEKILEEIEEATFQEDAPIYIGNMEVDGYVRASRVKDIIRSHMNEKEKVTSAEIISRKTDGKPYYGIKYKKVGEDHYTVGYSSYYLDYVIDWLNNCFEFCGESKIVVNVGKDTNVPSNDGWIPVEERLPEDCEEIVLVQVSGKPADNILFDNAFEFALYEKEEGWMLDNYPEWKNPDVIAWQSLPKPYRQPKKEKSSCKKHIMSRFMKVE